MSEWLQYFGDVREQEVFRMEAAEFVERLERAVPLSPSTRLLDFGCGFGFVSRLLAPRVREVALWDGSPRMRARAAATLSSIANAVVLDQEPSPDPGYRFDVIIVVSVIQYMSTVELRRWLPVWGALLTPGGSVVIADILPARFQTHRDLLDQVVFGLRRGFLFTSLKDGLLETRGYWTRRQSSPLTRLSRGDLEQLARDSGLSVEFLPRNLTCRSARLSVLMQTGKNMTAAASRL